MADDDLEKKAFEEIQLAMHATLETYSNVHRGSGHNSQVTTRLFEQAREIVLEYLGLNKRKYVVIFCSPLRAKALKPLLAPSAYQVISSREIGLSLGVHALVVKRNAIPKGIRFQAGGGTARLVSKNWVIWEKAPHRFEAGTPGIVNIIVFAKALLLIRQFMINGFQDDSFEKYLPAGASYHDELEKFSGEELLKELLKTRIGRNIEVPTAEGYKTYVNLDNAASTPTFTPIYDTVIEALCQPVRVQQEIISETRVAIAGLLNASKTNYDIIFTSNTTEGINLVADSLSHESLQDIEPVIVNTLLEHNSNDLPWRILKGFTLIRLQIDRNGFIDFNDLETILCAYNHNHKHGNQRIKLVAVSGASNVLGVFNDLAAICRLVHKYGAQLLVDAAQLVAHRKVDMEGWGIDFMSFSAHKVYAPFGCGVLVARKGLLCFPDIEFATIRSSGEENTAGIAALGKAIILLQRISLDLIEKKEKTLTNRALQGLSQIQGLRIFGIQDPELPEFDQKGGVIVFAIKKMFPDRVAKKLAQAGIGVRYGCHCSHILIKHLLKVGPSLEIFQHHLIRLFPAINLPGLARISLGIENTENDIDRLIIGLDQIAHKSQKSRSNYKKELKEFINAKVLQVYTNAGL
ncbi:MAG: aminotransferase class V-fold PLP-dependent enzyme [Bacteroidales bacterium]|jgi:selenocysteine lyase/cysteine desulfurase